MRLQKFVKLNSKNFASKTISDLIFFSNYHKILGPTIYVKFFKTNLIFFNFRAEILKKIWNEKTKYGDNKKSDEVNDG